MKNTSMATYTFHFGFEGDDIEEDPAEKPPLSSLPENSRTDEELLQNNMKRIDASFNEPKLHSLEDLVRENFMLFFFSPFSSETLLFLLGFGMFLTSTLG